MSKDRQDKILKLAEVVLTKCAVDQLQEYAINAMQMALSNKTAGGACPQCGASSTGAFCSACGTKLS